MVIQKFTKEIKDNIMHSMYRRPRQKETTYIGWKRPHIGWVKLNSDGAWKGA
ncbi:receptor-like kinase, partial [Trifolium medium]|nr:receptor-like kinase [Trifolium medium]